MIVISDGDRFPKSGTVYTDIPCRQSQHIIFDRCDIVPCTSHTNYTPFPIVVQIEEFTDESRLINGELFSTQLTEQCPCFQWK
uniref:Uncharacterized protein n=1 Tax=Parascaris univalens TaxID=6257 RepID=A0A915B4A0_PARUN